MFKYSVGQKFQDKQNEKWTCEILMVAPELDYEGSNTYFVEEIEFGDVIFTVFDERFLDEYYELVSESN